jgi:predicted SAM-dependent methyltransferase
VRHLLSYHKVQKVISDLIRGSRWFVRKKKIAQSDRLNIGCGVWPDPAFINLDYHWMPGVDVCWDLTRGSLPFHDASLGGCTASTVLIAFRTSISSGNYEASLRVLKPGGVFRLVLPDGELYLDLYHRRKTDKRVRFPYGENEATGMISVNRYAREHTHQYSYDYETLELLLREAGFRDVQRRSFKEGGCLSCSSTGRSVRREPLRGGDQVKERAAHPLLWCVISSH